MVIIFLMLLQNTNCGECKKKVRFKKNYNLLTAVFLAILPKCPFCVMAYSSTVMLCSKDSLIEKNYTHTSLLSVSITLFFCSLVILGLLLNFKGTKTKVALVLTSQGIAMLLISMLYTGGSELYYFGVVIIFFAIWLNGSLLSILRKTKTTYSSHSKAVTSGA